MRFAKDKGSLHRTGSGCQQTFSRGTQDVRGREGFSGDMEIERGGSGGCALLVAQDERQPGAVPGAV